MQSLINVLDVKKWYFYTDSNSDENIGRKYRVFS